MSNKEVPGRFIDDAIGFYKLDKHFLKSIRDNTPELIKHFASPFFRNKIVANKYFHQYLMLLVDRENLDQEVIKEYQLKQLKEIVSYSYQCVPYYRELFNENGFDPLKMNSFDDLKMIPFLTRKIIRENFNKLISSQKVKGGYYNTTTSGSTGEPLKILLDYNSIFKETAFVCYFRQELGYQIEDSLVTFRGIDFGGKLWKYNPMNNETIFSPFKLSMLTLDLYVKKINEIKPAYLNGYHSAIYYFTRLLYESNTKLDFSFKGIFFTSENVVEDERIFVESFFNVPSMIFYGHTERCVIAQEIKHNEYQFDPFYGFTELVEAEGNSFEIIGTGFLNRAMPLIRYKTEDVCAPINDTAVTIKGRRNINDFLIGINGEKIYNSSLHFLSNILGNVIKYQFIQSEIGKAELLVIPITDLSVSDVMYIKRGIDKKLKGIIDFEIKIVENMILSKRGKYQMFINTVRNI